MSSLEFNLFRHGQSLSNLSPDIVAGRGDNIPLTGGGELQATDLGLYLRGQAAPDIIDTSPLLRARRTAEIAVGIAGLHVPIRDEGRLIEQSLGDNEARLSEDVYTPELKAHLKDVGAAYRHPNGESMQDVGNRMYDWFIDRSTQRTRETLFVIHGYTHNVAIASLLARVAGVESPLEMRAYVLGLLKAKRIGNASRTLISVTDGRPRIECIGQSTEQTAV